MERKVYETPDVELVSMRNEKEVANTCWGGHSNSMTWYYDTQGEGYVSFEIKGGKCELNLDKVTYYTDKNAEGQPLDNNSAQYKELVSVLPNSGGNSGNPFHGEGKFVFPEKPGTNWS